MKCSLNPKPLTLTLNVRDIRFQRFARLISQSHDASIVAENVDTSASEDMQKSTSEKQEQNHK